MSEKTDVERPCVELAQAAGFLHYKFDRSGGVKGWPDAGFWGPDGDHFLVEFKKPGGRLSKIQEVYRKRFTTAGFAYYVVDNVEAFRSLMCLGR